MDKILPIIIICGVGLAVCAGLLILILVRTLRGKRSSRRKKEEYEMDERSMTINLEKDDLFK